MGNIKGSIAALVTPFNNETNQTVNYDKVADLVDFHYKNGTSAIVVCGTTGESPTLSYEEHKKVISVAVQAAKETGIKIIAGTGSNSTREAINLTTYAHEVGVDACLVVAPYYNKPTPEGLLAHFQDLDKISVPLIVYNIPSRTGINIEPNTLVTLAEECQNIIGLKASNGNLDQITETAYLVKSLNKPFSIFSGDDSLTLPILSVGGIGVISVAANFMPRVMAKLISDYEVKDTQSAKFIMHSIHPFCYSLLKLGSNPAPIKAVMNKSGMNVGSCRKPLVDISSDKVELLLSLVRKMKETFEHDSTLSNFNLPFIE